MSRKLMIAVLIMVGFAAISWPVGAAAAEEALKNKEARVQELKKHIQEIEHVLERERDKEKSEELKSSLDDNKEKLDRLMAEFQKPQKPEGSFPEMEATIRRTRADLKELRGAAAGLKAKEGEDSEELKRLREKIGQGERKLVELTKLLEKRRADAKQGKATPRSKLMIFSLKHASAPNLGEIIKKFLSPAGIIAADADTNSLIIKDAPNGLESASMIIKALDVQKKRDARAQQRSRQQQTEGVKRSGVFLGKVLEAGEKSLTIETIDAKDRVTLHVPLRRKEDGTRVPLKELSAAVAKLPVGSTVKVEWVMEGERRWIEKVTRTEK